VITFILPDARSEGRAEVVLVGDVEDDLTGVYERIDGFERRKRACHDFILGKDK
jgi:hypothetical protein